MNEEAFAGMLLVLILMAGTSLAVAWKLWRAVMCQRRDELLWRERLAVWSARADRTRPSR